MDIPKRKHFGIDRRKMGQSANLYESRIRAIERGELDELQSLGINVKRKNDLNDCEELGELACCIKQSMYVDYKLAYGKKGEKYKEEARATMNT